MHEENVLILLKNDADPNAVGKHGVTPLHRARDLGVAKILIRHGADECRACIISSERLGDAVPRTMTAFEIAVEMQPTTAKFCLDENIFTNGYDLTSRDLIIVLDLGIIINSGSLKQDSNGQSEDSEMAIHKKFARKNFTDLLEHPLSETFLVLKHQLLRGFAYWNLSLYFLFVVCLTSMSIVSTPMWACCPNSTINIASSVTDCLHSKPIECHTRVHMLFWDILHNFPILFWVLYIGTWIFLGLIIFREMGQALSNLHRYIFDKENWLEILMIGVTSGYLVTLLTNPSISTHLGGLAQVFAWADFALLIGTFPNLGIYIYMSIHIMKKIVPILLSFIPFLFGFAMAFHILLPNNASFDNIIISFLKVLVMMSGEFDFEDNFLSKMVKNVSGSNITTQVLFVFFLFMVSIVISNLLIGLTVNETEIVFRSALGMRLERTFFQIIAVEDLLYTSPFKRFSKVFNITRPTVLKHYLDSKKRDKEATSYQASNSYKISITPNYRRKDGYWWERLDYIGLSILRGINHPVYLYDEDSQTNGVRLTHLELPDSTVKRIFKIISERQEQKEIPGGNLAPARNSANLISNLGNEKGTVWKKAFKMISDRKQAPGGDPATTQSSVDTTPKLNDNVANLKLQLEEQSRLMQEKLENVRKSLEIQIQQSQEKIDENLARLECCLTRAMNISEEKK